MSLSSPEITTDPLELERIATDYLRGVLDGWEPDEQADPITWLVRAHALMVAEERDVAADVPFAQILRPLGERVHRIAPHAAAAATVSATVTVRDDAGYTVPAGMEVFVRTAGDDGVAFEVSEAVTVEPGQSATGRGEVALRAMAGHEGTQGNGLDATNAVEPIRSWEFVESIELVGTSSGGRDAEGDDEYLERLARELALTSGVPILPGDFAALARSRVASVGRALALNLRQARPEVIEVAASGSGTVDLSGAGGSVTASFAADADAATVEAAVSGATARASGGPLGTAPVEVELTGAASYGPWSVGVSSGTPTVSVTVTQEGGDDHPVPRAVTVAVCDADGEVLSSTARDEVRVLLDAMRETNFLVSVVDPDYTAIDVEFEATTWPGEDPATIEAAAVEAVRSYLDPATWGSGQPVGEQRQWVLDDTVRYLEVAQALNEVPGLRWVTRLEIGLEGRSLGTGDVRLSGVAPLARPGAGIRGDVTEG